MSAEKKNDNVFLGCLWEQGGAKGTFWRSAIDDDGGQYLLNTPKTDDKDYTFMLTYNPKAQEELDAFKSRQNAGEDSGGGIPVKSKFSPIKKKG